MTFSNDSCVDIARQYVIKHVTTCRLMLCEHHHELSKQEATSFISDKTTN